MNIEKNEALVIVGGAGLTAAFLSAFTSFFKTLYEYGNDLGRSIKSLVKGC